MTQYKAPNGLAIIGSMESVLCTCPIDGIKENGLPIYAGNTSESDVHWDTMEPCARDGKVIYLDSDAGEWRFDQLTKIENVTTIN